MEEITLWPQPLHRAAMREELRAYCDQVAATVGALLDAGVRMSDLGRGVSLAYDALQVRLLSDIEAALGTPPCPYAWLVLGSEGRYEQTLRTDQDNALVYADDAPPEAAAYFAMLAERMVEELVVCGFPRCPGEIMATNPRWRQPLQTWRSYFRQWINVPEEEALLRAAIFFDYRQVYGALDAEQALRPIIKRGREQRTFLGRLARAALRQPAPLNVFRQLVLERNGATRDLINLKLRGTALIVDLARLFALEAGCAATNTLVRLRESAASGGLSVSGAEELAAAFELIGHMRLRHQCDQLKRGEPLTNQVPVSHLSRTEQRELKQALRGVRDVQQSAEISFQIALIC